VSALLAGAGQAATERGFATVVAPYSGIVSARHVELGEMATPGKPLMTGFDPGTLRVTATVPQAQVAAIQAGAKARIELPSVARWIEAASLTVIPAADPRTHTTQVRIGLPAEVRGIYPGIYARAHFVTGRKPALLVPRAAVIRRSELTAVYVVSESVQLRQIRLGTAGDEKAVEVLAGLKPGERIALDPVKAGLH
jgi:RND family efflux transporter MFP subunit